MTVSKKFLFMWVAAIATGLVSQASAATTYVTGVQPYVAQTGWVSTDTRTAGVSATTQPQVDARIQFGVGPAGSNGSVNLNTVLGSDKATVAFVDTNGLGGLSNFNASYRWYKTSAGVAAPALKLGLQTAQYPAGVSSRLGENNWDKVLVYEPYGQAVPPTNAWKTETITPNSGVWSLYDRNTGTSHQAPMAGLTINDWFSHGTYGTLLSGATIVDVQIGQGSGNENTNGYVDWLQASNLNGGDLIDFGAIPEPTTLGLAGIAAIGMIAVRRRQR